MTDGHPILFSAGMVKAILREDNPKSQTRRVVKDLDKLSVFLPFRVKGDWPIGHHIEAHSGPHKAYLNQHGAVSVKGTGGELLGVKPSEFTWLSPYGCIGEKLWVREAWRVGKPHDKKSPTQIWDGLKDTQQGVTVLYEAGGWRSVCPVERAEPQYPDDEPMPSWAGRKRSSMFLPRWASRISLDITDIRVQRLHDISEEDAKAEGVSLDCPIGHIPAYQKSPYVYCFAQLWDKINAKKYPWANNAFVWAISFRKI